MRERVFSWRRFAAAVLLFCLAGSAVCAPSARASGDEVRAAKRVVAVVYDDSGSMTKDLLEYTNYSLQTLTSLMNARDELYVVYMSDVYSHNEGVTAILLDSEARIAASVKTIQGHNSSGGTPVDSVTIARDRLAGESAGESGDTQYRLIILTDGQMIDYDAGVDVDESKFSELLRSCAGYGMNSGAELYVDYVGMGAEAPRVDDRSDPCLKSYNNVADAQTVYRDMADIANQVSGRLPVEEKNVTWIDGRTVQIRSDLPLFSLAMLSQQSSASVVSAEASHETALSVERNIALNAGGLFGNTAIITNRSSVIPAGEYTITFSEEVSPGDLTLLYEPAIGLSLAVNGSGGEPVNAEKLRAGSEVSVELIPVIPGTDERIPPEDLPKDITWRITYETGDQVREETDGTSLSGVSILPEPGVIRGSMQLPGFAPLIRELPVDPYEPLYGLVEEQPDELVYRRADLGGGSEGGGEAVFRITDHGSVLPAEEARELELQVVDVEIDDSGVKGFFHRFGRVPADCELRQNEDGSFSLRPRGLVNRLFPFLTRAGEYHVTVGMREDESVTAQGSFTVVPSPGDWIHLIGFIVLLLLLLYLIYIFLIKRHFKGQTLYLDVFRQEAGRPMKGHKVPGQCDTRELTFFTGHFFSLRRSCWIEKNGLRIYAEPYGARISSASVAEHVKQYLASSAKNPESDFGSIRMSLRKIDPAKKNQVPDIMIPDTKGRACYFCDDLSGKTIWSLHIE